MKKCLLCGNFENGNNVLRCSRCGGQLVSYEESGERKTAPSSKNRTFMLVMIFIIVAIIAVTVVGIVAILNKDTTGTQPGEKTEETAPEKKKSQEETKAFEVTEPEESNASEVHSEPNSMIINCEANVTLRKTASVSGEEIMQIPLNAQILYHNYDKNGFCKVSYKGMTGYVLVSYVSVPQPISTSSYAQVIKCEKDITLRATPSKGGAQMDLIGLGTVVEVIGVAENGFYCVKYNGKYGFALASYLTAYSM